jgi:hypothetical protein
MARVTTLTSPIKATKHRLTILLASIMIQGSPIRVSA